VENKVTLEILGLSSSQSQTGSFALILGEIEGSRRLPIIIGMFEAQAIAIEIEEIAPNRPMTHDLFRDFAENFDIEISHVNISFLKEGVFYAEVHCKNNSKQTIIDARPSDAIALALRFDAPIFTNEKIMSEAGIIIEDEDDSVESEVDDLLDHANEVVQEEVDSNEHTLEDLNLKLAAALKNEDYEEAARIRDKINKKAS
jgi:hypothetical protein